MTAANGEPGLGEVDVSIDADGLGPMARLRRLLAGRFGRMVLPAVILQSVLVGGGYASGREVVEFGGRFGALGWASVLAIFLGFTVTSILVFELARVAETYEYKSFMQTLIGRFWPAFDLLFAAMAVLIIAVMASAAGNILETTVGVPYLASIAAILAVVGFLLYKGSDVIEAFKTVGSAGLYGGFLLFAGLVLLQRGGDAAAAFQIGSGAFPHGATLASAFGAGVLYVGYNLAVYPAVLFVLHRQTETRETVLAGVLAGAVMTLPFLLTYVCVLAFYPNPAVLDAAVPWLAMLDATAPTWIVGLYGLVVGWTLLETSLGLIHALLDRVDTDLARIDAGPLEDRDGLTPRESGLVGAGILLGAALLSQVGIISLIATGYTAMAYAFIAIFALPLLTVGLGRILEAHDLLEPARALLGRGERDVQ